MKTQGSLVSNNMVERLTAGSALADLLPILRSWSSQIARQLHEHVSGQQPRWLSHHESIAQWAETVRQIGWQAQVVTPEHGRHGWDIYLSSPDDARIFAVWAVGLIPSLVDGSGLSLIERGLARAQKDASDLRSDRSKDRLVLAFLIPYVRSDESLPDDWPSVIDRLMVELPLSSDRTASAFVLGDPDRLRNAAGWSFPAAGIIATLV